jgi:hypothetical protein|tara:strand:- start:18464 stop:19957 length:1494 start_codon:yes stop_codon:yes gene_type:complete
MGLLDNTTQQSYYQGDDYGNYQFTSLDNIITQFKIAYVGESKLISKIKRADISFFAQRALQELSFDTFKSCKSQEIVLPPSLQMILPRDYVNYTKVSWVDSSGVKHPLYPTSKTSNPTKIIQDSDGNYEFPGAHPVLVNQDFSSTFAVPWYKSDVWTEGTIAQSNVVLGTDAIEVVSGELTFTQHVHNSWNKDKSRLYYAYQKIDVSNLNSIELSAKGTAAAAATDVTGGTLVMGLIDFDPTGTNTLNYSASNNYSELADPTAINWLQTIDNENAYLEWLPGSSAETKTLIEDSAIDVSNHNDVWVIITSKVDFSIANTTASAVNSIDDIVLTNTEILNVLKTDPLTSTTWDNYKSNAPSENSNQDYEDDIHWKMKSGRYGLDPQHAQVNGSFYIDCKSGKIHFSSNVSGQTVVLDYISDSLGTDEEMQVHKLAEEAMYKHIAYAIVSTRSNVPEYIVQRFKKEKFAETRKAKLRLSNIKLEEITQILRGKSKQIKH